MEVPAKRNAIMDFLFGARLTGDDLARHLAARPPRWVRDTQGSLYLLILVLTSAGYLGLIDRLPIVGPWLAREGSLVSIGCLAIIIALDWYYRERAEKGRKP